MYRTVLYQTASDLLTVSRPLLIIILNFIFNYYFHLILEPSLDINLEFTMGKDLKLYIHKQNSIHYLNILGISLGTSEYLERLII